MHTGVYTKMSTETPTKVEVFSVQNTLVAEIHCDVGHDASITAIAMPRCGELG